MLKEADFDRIVGSLQTALNEDRNFYGVSPTLQSRLPAALEEYRASATEFIALTQRLAHAEKSDIPAAEFVGKGTRARNASFALWRVAEQEMDQLLKLPGVARKTANVVLGVAFGKAEGVVVDTHVQRLSVRLNFTMESRPDKIEEDLMKLFPREKWIHLSHLLIHHGRAVCQARRPKCIECPIEDLCKSADKVMV